MTDLSRIPFASAPGRAYRLKGTDGPPLAADLTAPALTVDRGEMAVEAVICTPLIDHQGDVVEPAGVDLSVHKLNPVVFYDHRTGTAPHILPIGKAEDKAGNYTVRLVELPGNRPALVAKTYFAQSSRFAGELFGLIADDSLRGVSIGFAPGKVEKGLRAPVEVLERPRAGERGSFRFHRSILHEYSHTPAPVNPEALTVKVQKANYRSTCPELYRALQPYLVTSGATVTVPRTVRKAMDETTPDAAPVDALTPPPADDLPSGDTKPTARAAFNLAQAFEDACTAAEADLEQGEHTQGIKAVRKVIEAARALAQKANAVGEKVESDTAGDDAADDMPEDVEDMPEAGYEKSATGQFLTKSGFKPRRATFAEVEKAKPVEKSDPALTPDQQAALERRIRRLETAARKTR